MPSSAAVKVGSVSLRTRARRSYGQTHLHLMHVRDDLVSVLDLEKILGIARDGGIRKLLLPLTGQRVRRRGLATSTALEEAGRVSFLGGRVRWGSLLPMEAVA